MKREELRKVEFENKSGKSIEKGYFHKWSTDCYNTGDGVGHYPVGIIENEKGEIQVIHAESIKFIS